jgi:hypothetical protein
MATNFKTSVLLGNQIPEFIRDEYPLFVSFIQAYYEFLEQKQGTEKNDLITQAKELRDIKDVDVSMDKFEDNFFNTFATLFPKDSAVNKEILIKQALPIYLSKGSQKSFQLLFRLLFGEELEIIYPRDNILRASDGKWTIDSKLRINQNILGYYSGNGATKIFNLAQPVNDDEIQVSINGVVQTTGYYVLKEYSKLVFNDAPPADSEIVVLYTDFNIVLFRNRKVTGIVSGATAIIEDARKRIVTDEINLGFPVELTVSKKSIEGTFLNGEDLTIPILDADGQVLDIRASTFSIVRKINIENAGSSYQVGDLAIILGGGATIPAVGEITSVFSGAITNANVLAGGAIFTSFSPVTLSPDNQIATIVVNEIDTTGQFGANTYVVATDVVANQENVVLSSASYGFPSTIVASQNLNTKIIDTLSFDTLTVGSIISLTLVNANGVANVNPILDANGATFLPVPALPERSVKSLKGIGRILVNSGGIGYIPGDEVIFGPNPLGTYGEGAAAVVSRVSSSGGVSRIDMQPPRISGTANIQSSNVTIVGTGTNFNTELRVGDRIIVNNETRIVNAISSATRVNVNVAFTTTSTNRKVGLYEKLPVGGINYVQNNFPLISISSPTGSGANIQILCCVSDGEQLSAAGTRVPGEIIEVAVTYPGERYRYIPQVFFQSDTGSGASGNVEIETVIVESAGRWKTTDSILSSSDRKLQGKDYYIDFSYVLSSKKEFSKYKEIFRELIHPAGYIDYALYNKESIVAENTVIQVANVTVKKAVSGSVNVNNTIFVVGTSTKFNLANSLGILTIGSSIAVNNVVRTVNSIISNTMLTVSVPFTTVATAQTVIILT